MVGNVMALLASWIVAAIGWGGYGGIAFLMALESACTPLPSEIIMPFAGYLVGTGRFNLWLVATAGAVGCNIGSAVAYAIGEHGGRRAILRWGRYVLLEPSHLDWADRFFARFGGPAVFFGRLLPFVRTFIALPAGIARMDKLRFHLYTFVGSWIWCLALAYIGKVLGDRWNTDPVLRGILHKLDLLAVVALVLAVAWFVWRRLRPNRAA